MRLVILLLDACRHDYIKNMPFLKKLSNDGVYVKKVKPSASFCERAEILTGMHPATSDCFTAIAFDRDNSPYKDKKGIIAAYRLLNILGTNGRKITRRLAKKNGLTLYPYNIPIDLLPELALTEDLKPHDKIDAFNNESLVDILLLQGRTVDMSMFTALGRPSVYKTEDERLAHLDDALSNGTDLIFTYIGTLDTAGHHSLNQDDAMKEACLAVDNKIKQIYENYICQYDDVALMVVGDHGMTRVDKKINFSAFWENYRSNKKFLLFLDSTYARLKCITGQQEDIDNAVEFLNNSELNQYGIAEVNTMYGKRYGDIIWSANIGVLIEPDYFNVQCKDIAMHGYKESNEDLKGLMVVVARTIEKKCVDECELADVCPTVCHLLKINTPNKCEGKSLI